MRERGPAPTQLEEETTALLPPAPAAKAATTIPDTVTQYPLSYGQRALWLLEQARPQSAAYNVVYAARFSPTLDIAAFHRALQRLVSRHPVLRTTFVVSNGEPLQRVHAHQEVCFQVKDAERWSEAVLEQALTEEVYRPFDLAHGPLMRFTLLHQATQGYLAILSLHHSITDLWSLAIFMYELGLLYTAEKTGAQAPLKPLKATYADFVRAQQQMLAGPEGERLWAYWQRQLGGELPLLNLPTDRPRPAQQSDRGATVSIHLSPQLRQQLNALAKAQGTNLLTISLAAFHILLHRYSGQDEILVATPKACRDRKMARVLGYFVNPVVIRAKPSGKRSFLEFLAQMHQTVTEGFAHGEYPFSLLVERLQVTRDASRPALCQVALAWQKTTSLVSQQMIAFALNEGGGRLEVAELNYESVALPVRVAPFELTLQMGEIGDALGASMEYNTDLFDASTIARMLKHLQRILEGIASAPQQRLAELPLLTETERQQLLVAWNQTAVPYPDDQCIHQLFEAQVEQQPEAVAVTFEAQHLSYRELNRRANKVAHYLQKLGVGPEQLVGICLERSIEMIVAMLGVLKAGAAYLPLDPTYPTQRLAFMLADAQVQILLTQKSLLERVSPEAAQVICLDADWEAVAQENELQPSSRVRPDNLAYCIYTSGSTGRPKGALLTHRGLCNLVAAQRRAFSIDSTSRILQFAPFSFDASVWESFMALANGATLCLAQAATLASLDGLHRLLEQEQITVVTLPPSMLDALSEQALPALKSVIAAGESCTQELVKRWARGRDFYNAYGPTETTVCAAMELCSESLGSHPPIGRPLANTQLYILDVALRQPVPVGVTGELYIGGISLARGYVHGAELTAERFIPNPFATEPGQRLYKTGDLARYLADGKIQFLGRIDDQVKLRGLRIELGEIERVLEQHPRVRRSVVIAQDGPQRNKRLVAYLVAEGEPILEAGELKRFLRSQLPEYMVPSAFVCLERLPLLENGKVDRRALPAPPPGSADSTYVKPLSALEELIAGVWQEMLGVEKVGTQDNFFDLGGHSLLMARVHSRLQELLGREIPIVEMFRYPTIKALAQYLTGRRHSPVQPDYDRLEKQIEALKRRRQRLREVLSVKS